MAPEIQLTYAVPVRRYGLFAWVSLLIMGIVSIAVGVLAILAFILQLFINPAAASPWSVDFNRILIAGSVLGLATTIAGGLYFWCSRAVYRNSRLGTRLGRGAAIFMAILYTLFLLLDPLLLALHVIQCNSIIQFALANVIRISFVVASVTLAWLLSRRLAEMN